MLLSRLLPYSKINSRIVEKSESKRLGTQLSALTTARLFLNTGIRVIYPFAPAFARGLGVNTADISRLITLRNATGFLSPFFGPLSERYGQKNVLMGGMLLFGLACLFVVVWPTYWMLGLTLVLMGIAKIIYDPAMQANLGDTVPYAQRGRAIAITEYAWALALLLGAPAVGFAVQKWGWQSPFLWLGILGLLSIIFLSWALPRRNSSYARKKYNRNTLQFIKQNPVVFYAVLYIALVMLANEMLFIVFGSWMEKSFQLSLAGLGIAAAIIGGAEITGETIAGWSVDRFGKRPIIIFTGICNAIAYLILPYSSGTLWMALLTLFIIFLTFEITVVGGMPLMTELVPNARAVVMSLIIAAAALGRTLGAFFGVLVWESVGFKISGLVWALIMGAAVIILTLFIREGSDSGNAQ
jgi:predicted MFS family arabinose efflux permease